MPRMCVKEPLERNERSARPRRRLSVLACFLLSACATSAISPSPSVPRSAGPLATEPTALLWDRIRIRLPPGSRERSEELANLLADGRAGPSRETVFLTDETGRLVTLEVEELFATAVSVDRLSSVLRERFAADADVSAIEAAGGTPLVIVRPRSTVGSAPRVVLEAYAVASDGYVLLLRVFANWREAQTPGGSAFAERLLRTVEAGTRSLRDDSGRRSLWPRLAMVVPSGFHVSIEGSYDFEMLRIREAVPFGEPAREIRIGLARMVWPSHPESADRAAWQLFGRPAELRTWQENGRLHAESSFELERLDAVVQMEASDAASLNRLLDVGGSLAIQMQSRSSTSSCADTSPPAPRATSAEPEILGDADLSLLRRSTRFVIVDASHRDEPLPHVRAFQRILRRVAAREAFLDLVAHGTTAGRLYGLAGLWWVDRALFDSSACAVRSVLDAEVEVVDACGVERRPTASVLVDPDAIRGEWFWWPQTWSEPLRTDHLDIAGGSLVATLAHPSLSREMACRRGR